MDPVDFLPLHPKDFLILLVLAEGDRHGYGILKAAEERSRGKVSLDPANLYRRLQRLTRDGLVEDAGEGGPAESDGAPRRYHTLTASGRSVLGSLAFSVSRRIREFGIRMAVGADRISLLRRVLGEGVVLVIVALAAGAGASVALGRFLSGQLFGVEPLDPASILAAGGILGGAALLAAPLPALRATRIDPSEALRTE